MSSSTSNLSKFIHGSAFRPVLVWILCVVATGALASIVSLLGITPAWSAPSDVPSVTVSFRDLDLSTPEGANTLYRRIRTAAQKVCGYAGADVLSQNISRACYRNAIADAVAKVNSPLLTAVHTGRPTPMTAMVAK